MSPGKDEVSEQGWEVVGFASNLRFLQDHEKIVAQYDVLSRAAEAQTMSQPRECWDRTSWGLVTG